MNQRVALVTGGTGGIGTAISRRLTQEGYRVVAGYFNRGNHEKAQLWQLQQREAGFLIDISYADLKDPESCLACYLNIRETIGPVDILVNNAGITQDSSFKKMTFDQWQTVMDTNLTSVFTMTQRVVQDMVERSFGRIINISSVNGLRGRFGQTNYAAAKAGMHGFSKSLAFEVARKGVTVNTISPGYIATDMIMSVPEEVRNKILAEIPMGRFGEAEEVAAAVAFLVSNDAAYITGANLSINGGQHTY
ncbi:acetoacetyl-CoA reductase [Aliikangiella maris]|uniref:Acetoacetyl-CoA reductase n=2 Tax=Aliikangiella maris TaxID=3162458 RepID=A0ABV3MS51_9GAMM